VDLAGAGPLVDDVRAEITRLGLDDRVRVVGTITTPREFWRDCHAAVLASDSEGSPNALIEAALCGRPLLGTDGGGTPEVIGPSGGLVVSVDDTAGLVEALERLIDDAALRERLAAGAYEHARHEFGMERAVDSQLAVIREALGRGPRLPAP
jgi:glycosyltransferase involved in cell wall biosynthesis